MAKGLFHAKYSAIQIDDTVTVFATGVHYRDSFHVSLEPSGLPVFPPAFFMVQEMIRPDYTGETESFIEMEYYPSADSVNYVVVYDSNGENKVPVTRMPTIDHVNIKDLFTEEALAAKI